MDKITDITILIDRSGSMGLIKDDMVDGLNNFIKEQKQIEGKCNITVAQFDHEFEYIVENTDIENVNKLSIEPRGSTALLDAIGKLINGTRIRVDKNKPNYVVIMIVTDGYENASREYTKQTILELIKQEEKRGWNFLYLGANQDAIATGMSYGFSAVNSAGYDASSIGTCSMWTNTSQNICSYRMTGNSDNLNYTDEMRSSMEGNNA